MPRSSATTSSTDWIVRFQPSPTASLRLFCFPFAGGGARAYRPWAEALPDGVEVCAVQPPGRGRRLNESPVDRMDPLVDRLLDEAQPLLDRPFAVFGHSLGALVSFEWVRRLHAAGGPSPRHLVVSGHIAPHLQDPNPDLHDLPRAEILETLAAYGGTPDAVLDSEEMMDLFLPTMRADFAVLETYEYGRAPLLDVPITAVAGADDPRIPSRAHLEAWGEHTSAAFDCQLFPGDHFYFNDAFDPLRDALVDRLRPHLDAV